MHRYTEELARHGVVAGQVLLTVDDVTRRSHYRNAHQTFAKLLELGVLPIVNENDTVATTEIRFGDNDRLAALVAHLVHADLLVLLSDVDGLYDADPASARQHAGARGPRRRRPRGRPGREGRRRPGSAPAACRPSSTPPGSPPGPGSRWCSPAAERVADALAGEPVGTLFHATGRRRPTRLLWLAHATEPVGTLLLDDGAVAAVTQRRASLLAAGVTGVVGTFHAGDPVDIAGPGRCAGGPRAGELRLRGAPGAARPLLEGAQARARRGVRA